MATFTNQATLTYNGGTVNSNIVTGELVQVLTASKTAAAESYRTGDLVTYVVQLRSTGAAALTGLTVTDTLGTTNYPAPGGTVQLTPLTYQAGTLRYFMNGVLQTAPAVTVLANGIRIEGITVPAGGVSTLAYTARVNAFADPSAAGAISNTASVTGGFVALALACRKLVEEGVLASNPIRHFVTGVSAGIVGETLMLDLQYSEDSRAQVDLNCVMNELGEIIELQGTGEGRAFTPQEQQELVRLCAKGNRELLKLQREILKR